MVPVMTKELIVLTVAVLGVSCQPKPNLKVRANSPLSYPELVKRSPVVVVAKVVAVKVIGPEVRTTDEHRYPLRLQRVTALVENILKGTAPLGEVTFNRYGWSPDAPMAGPWGVVVVGQRNVFFLDTEGGTLRSMIDLYPAQIEVLSGRRSGYWPDSGRTVEGSIAEFLLIPGEDVRAEAFSQSLSTASGISMELVGQADTLRLLKSLIMSKELPIRAQACLVIRERFKGQVQCGDGSR
jgi:hypothetical protein